jgi:tRNA uridine 5-carboxymethylaminomethyl modification enzyme
MRRPELTYEELVKIDTGRIELPRGVRTTAEIQIKYEGYINRELQEIERQKRLEDKLLPSDIDYESIRGLRLEAIEKLSKIRPVSIGQASRISGVSPADIGVLLIYLNG